MATIAASALAAAAVLLATLSLSSWLADVAVPPEAATERTVVEPLPVVRPSEVALSRARTLFAEGHLRDALRSLDRIGFADPWHAEAERVRAEVQRVLIGAGVAGPAPGLTGASQ